MKESFYNFQNVKLNELLDLLAKHKKLGLAAFLALLSPFLLLIILSTDSFVSKASITIAVEPIQSMISLRTPINAPLENEIKYLTSDSVIVSALNDSVIKSYLGDNSSNSGEINIDNINEIQSAISVKNIPNSNLVHVTFTHQNNAFAKDYLFALIKAYKNELIRKSTEILNLKHDELVALIVDLEEAKNNTVADIQHSTENLRIKDNIVGLNYSENLSSDDYFFIINNLKSDSEIREKILLYKNIVNSLSVYNVELLNIKSIIAKPKAAIQVLDDITIENQTIGRNKKRTFVIGILFSIISAIILIFIKEWFSDSIGSDRVTIRALSNIAPIISMLDFPQDVNKQRSPYITLSSNPESNLIAQYLKLKKKQIIAFHTLGGAKVLPDLVGRIGSSLFVNGSRVLLVSFSNQSDNYHGFIDSLQNNDENGFLHVYNYKLMQSIFSSTEKTKNNFSVLLLDEDKAQQKLLYGQENKNFFNDIRGFFDYIFIDVPIKRNYSDFISILNLADLNILNILSPIASRKSLNSIISLMDICESSISGIVVTKMSRNSK